jgi:hypothetical protein
MLDGLHYVLEAFGTFRVRNEFGTAPMLRFRELTLQALRFFGLAGAT